jgi:Protein of unknown function (DUF2934)
MSTPDEVKPAAKKRKPATKKKTLTPPSREEIGRLAEQFWIDRGKHDGHAEQDWLRAEQELLAKAS